jgi:hypothetical protein
MNDGRGLEEEAPGIEKVRKSPHENADAAPDYKVRVVRRDSHF